MRSWFRRPGPAEEWTLTIPIDRLRAALGERYVVQEKLGAGGMATVWLARDLKYDRAVALKVLNTDLASRVGVERFRREIAIAARLSHPHILPLFESGEAAGALYYTMPCVTGETLRDRLRRERQLPLADVVAIARAVADALDYAHHEGVVHRDIKPENILFQEGQPLVADFGVATGIAAAADDRLTATGVAIGTVHYMSPEQAAGDRAVDERADIYALGCVVYEMMAGVPPFQGATADSVLRQHITGDPPALAAHRPDLPEAIEPAVRKALAKTPADRWPTGAVFVAALESSRGVARRKLPARVRAVVLGVGAVAAMALVATRLFPAHRVPDPNLIAVAPFEVLVPRLAAWREGGMTLLARNLDGAGSLRAVTGAASAAGIKVTGALVPVGVDSVRLEIVAVNAASGRAFPAVERRGVASGLDALLESATIELLGEVGRTARIAATGARPLGSASLAAVKAFLTGEQYFRRAAWDSAAAFYDGALRLDSTFALAWSRWARVRGLREGFPGSEALDMRLAAMAGRLNHGLSPRDSLLLVLDSLREALYRYHVVTDDRPYWALGRRLDATALEAVGDRYREDGEVWYQVAEAAWYWGRLSADVTQPALLQAYDSAIALDPGFAPAYPHAFELALLERGPVAAERRAAAYLGLHPHGGDADDVRRADSVLRTGTSGSPMRALTGGDAGRFSRAADLLRRWPDTAETAVRLYRAVLAGAGPDAFIRNYNRDRLAEALAYRGHVDEAFRYAPDYMMADLAWLGGVPSDTAAHMFAGWLRKGGLWPFGLPPLALPFWLVHRDTVSLSSFIRRADSLARSRGTAGAALYGRNVAALARAYLELVRGDTAAALARLLGVPDSSSSGTSALFVPDRLIKAQVLAARRRYAAAATLLRDARLPPTDFSPVEGLWALEWARVCERLRRTDEARRGYQFTADVWMHADSELQPYVAEARAALRRLSAPPRPAEQ